MGLDEFKSGTNDNSYSNDKDNIQADGDDVLEIDVNGSTYETISEYIENNDEDSGTPNLKHTGSEGKDHFNTKSRVAIQMYKMGWNVSVEKYVSIENNGHLEVDILAIGDPDNISTDMRIPADSIIAVEIGGYSQPRAKKILNVVDAVLWIGKGKNLSDAVVIQDLVPQDEEYSFKKSYTYESNTGKEIEPKLDKLYVDRYKMIAKEIMAAFNSVDNIESVMSYLNNCTDYSVTEPELEKILTAIGFIEEEG